MVETTRRRIKLKSQVLAQRGDRLRRCAEKLPVIRIDTLLPRKRLHRLRAVIGRVESDTDDLKAVLTQDLLCGLGCIEKVLRGGRADMVAGRENHADQQRRSAIVMQADFTPVRRLEAVVTQRFPDGSLRKLQRLILVVLLLTSGVCVFREQ